MSGFNSLDDIFNDADEYGLLDVKPRLSPAQSMDARLLEGFVEISEFYRVNQREPDAKNGMSERKLFKRLEALRADAVKCAALSAHDVFHLLTPAAVITSLADIFEDDDGLLDDGADLFELKHVTLDDQQRAQADFVARRKPCKNFADYEAQFKQVQKDLVDGTRKLLPFTDAHLFEHTFYVHNGVVLLLEQVNIETLEKTLPTGKRIRKDGRTRCVFENGTESNMLYRSLAKILYVNGQIVSPHVDEENLNLVRRFGVVDAEDAPTGFIYVLSSKSNAPAVKSIEHLYKIGYSTTSVEERIKNAADEPTYLMADVLVVAIYDCFNLTPQEFERGLHTFFGQVCVQLDIVDKKGRRHNPREWFVVPFNLIERAIELIISGEITHYTYDTAQEMIVPRKAIFKEGEL
jgi:hypothetical protein